MIAFGRDAALDPGFAPVPRTRNAQGPVPTHCTQQQLCLGWQAVDNLSGRAVSPGEQWTPWWGGGRTPRMSDQVCHQGPWPGLILLESRHAVGLQSIVT